MDFRYYYNSLREDVESTLHAMLEHDKPKSLYEPIRYILAGGGKRVRPVLAMMACEAVGAAPHDALHAGVAVEIIHNFTLVHDDIMDAAPMRRNRPTVHKKWNDNVAILAGDCMMGVAYQTLMQTPRLTRIAELIEAFNQGIIEVCEGQAYDLDFQSQHHVSLDEYLMMIEKKTAKMLELAVVAGALVGDASDEHIAALRTYAQAVGVGFQIQDDLLDVIGEEHEFGKTIGGDIVEGKKTFLILRAEALATEPEDRALIERFVAEQGLLPEEVPTMVELFRRLGVIRETRLTVDSYMNKANAALTKLPDNQGKAMLSHFAEMLAGRTS